MNKSAFVISVVLTTFVLMSVGGVVYALRAPDAAPVPGSAEESAVEAAPAPEQSLEQILLERETIYLQRIAEANARLEQAQQQLAAQSSPAAQQAGGQTLTTQITADQAAQIAADYFGQTSVAWVEIVTVKGEQLYLVTFPSGELVYVSMTGQVVGSAPAQFSPSSNGGGGHSLGSAEGTGSGEGDQDDDHDEDHEDDHDDEHEDD